MISVGAVMFIRSRGAKPDIEEITEVPDWGTPVKVYVQECIKSIGKDAIIKLGQHGGFIDPYDEELSGRYFNIDLRNPIESDAVPLTPQSDIPIPYWFFMTGRAINLNRFPSPARIIAQLNLYIERNIDSCLKDFESFRAQGFDIEKTGDIETETTITPTNVLFRLIYPIRIKKGEQSIDVNTYRENLDINLNDVLNLAYDITAHQINHLFLELLVMEMISSYSGIDITKLPPIAASDSKMFTISWPIAWVEKMFTDKLISFIQYINIEGTKGAVHLSSPDPIVQSIYNKLYIDVTPDSRTYPGLKADFLYLGWPIHFNVLPNSGGKISPDVSSGGLAGGILPFGPTMRTNRYQFSYDVSFPVIVKIEDDDAFHGEGYTLFFALEGNIYRNRDMAEIFQIGGLITAPTTTTDPQGNVVPIPKNLFCNEGQKIVPVRILTKDASTNHPLEDVEVIYGCGTFKSCPIGVTGGYDSDKDAAYFEGKFPACHGGYLLLKKPGYLDEAVLFSTVGLGIDSTALQEVVAYLEPIREREVSLVLYRMTAPDTCCTPGAPLEQGEMAMITVSKVVDPDDPYEQPLDSILIFSSDVPELKVKLVPGWYEVSGLFYSDSSYTIYANSNHLCENTIGLFKSTDSWDDSTNTPLSVCESCCSSDTICFEKEGEGCACSCTGQIIPFLCCDAANEWFPDEDFEINPMGGVTITEANGGAWRIYKADLDLSNEVEFHVIIPPNSTCISTDGCVIQPAIPMDEMNRIDEYSETFSSYALPRFK